MRNPWSQRARRPLRSLAIGVLGGGGAAAVVAGVLTICVWVAVTTGLLAPFEGRQPRIFAFILACAIAGSVPGILGSRVRTPGLAALLGAATAIAASGIYRLLDPGADDGAAAGTGHTLARLLMPGLPGLTAPLVWSPVRTAAAHSIGRATVEIAVRVGALGLALLSALLAAPAVLVGGTGLLAGLLRPQSGTLLVGAGYTMTAFGLIAGSCLCLRLAGVPRGSGRLAGFESRPHRASS
jgi:hypothetical protein